MSLIVRPIQAADRPRWTTLWRDYLAFYDTELPDQIFETTFNRLTDDSVKDYNGLIAEVDGTAQGLTHYLFHRHGWKVENVCYLQDLYATPETRGTGLGRALIEGVYGAADAAGTPSVYWLTQDSNADARKLYDRVGTLTPFIKYARPA